MFSRPLSLLTRRSVVSINFSHNAPKLLAQFSTKQKEINEILQSSIKKDEFQQQFDSHTGLVSYYNPFTKEIKFSMNEEFKKATLWRRAAACGIDLILAEGILFSNVFLNSCCKRSFCNIFL